MMQFRYFVITLTALLGFSGSLNAAGPGGDIGGGSCSVAGYNALMNFNYDSGFPLRIMANITVSGSDVSYPPGATNQSICKCGKIYGYTRGMWLPTRFVEVVRRADCSPGVWRVGQADVAADGATVGHAAAGDFADGRRRLVRPLRHLLPTFPQLGVPVQPLRLESALLP